MKYRVVEVKNWNNKMQAVNLRYYKIQVRQRWFFNLFGPYVWRDVNRRYGSWDGPYYTLLTFENKKDAIEEMRFLETGLVREYCTETPIEEK